MSSKAAEQQLAGFIERYSPEVQAVAHAALKIMRQRLPGAVELVYDNYNALAVTFGATERRADVIFSITLYPRWVSLFFTQGASLPDPEKMLKGTGTSIRHIVLEGPATLNHPAVRTLMHHALEHARTPIDGSARRQLIIKSVSTKQRARRPA